MKHQAVTDWLAAPAYVWEGASARPVVQLEAPGLELLRGIDRQKAAAAENVLRHRPDEQSILGLDTGTIPRIEDL